MRVLLVEDDKALADALTGSLMRSGFGVDAIANGLGADTALLAGTYDLVVLDVELPALDGFEILRRLRKRGDKTPVLMLTARDDVEDRVKGLDLGADDYLTKPFASLEFEARVRSTLRRGQDMDLIMEAGPMRLDTEMRQLEIGEKKLLLSAREVSILQALMANPGRLVKKSKLAQQISSWDMEVGSNAIEVYVHRLRKKLESGHVSIRTIHGLGYVLEIPSDD